MDAKRYTGPQAGSQKYDLLTALSVAGLNGSAGFQTSMLRLVALVTARYNWARNELTVGQREMARLWSVDERTVKREIKRLTQASILLQLRPGVRGRVAAYRLNIAEIFRLSAPVWQRVGPDFAHRMEQQGAQPVPATVTAVDFAASHPPAGLQDAAPAGQGGAWARTLARLAELEPALHRSWFVALKPGGCDAGVLTLRAASEFQARYVQTHHHALLLGTAQMEYPDLRRIEICA
ncbi:hypothetical protein [Marinovum sp.]|uniref:hypothetical protein n=1 Tax=Marinovum sp. TaxID=2024839 RepID=UPI002B27130A|nr:hypothetical protein [Marinovum sp.]